MAPIATCAIVVARIASDGVRMSPLPRTIEISALHSQMAGAPMNNVAE